MRSKHTQNRLVDRFNSPLSTFPEVRIDAERLSAGLNPNFLSKKNLENRPRLDSTVESRLSFDAVRDKTWEPDDEMI